MAKIPSQKLVPFKGMLPDLDETAYTDNHAALIKNMVFELNNNKTGSGSNGYSFTPTVANEIYQNLNLPTDGINTTMGYHQFKVLNQGFVFVHNTANKHTLYRINADRTSDIVLSGAILNLQLDPAHFIALGRCTAQVATRVNAATGEIERITYLIFTDNFNEIRFICVEDAIATNGFSSTNPYFAKLTGDKWLNLGIATPVGCLGLTPIPRTDAAPDKDLPNTLNKSAWQFRIRQIDVWGRPSEYGDISDQYISFIGNSCVSPISGPRCLNITIPAGNPFIVQTEVLVRKWNGNVRGFSTETDWYQVDRVDKYKSEPGLHWWEREIRDDIGYNEVNNTFEYKFCADKELLPVDVNATNRGENPLALTASTVFPMNKRIGLGNLRKGLPPMDKDELAKVTFSVTPPSAPGPCDTTKSRKVTIYAILYSIYEDTPVPLRKAQGRNSFGIADCYGRSNSPFEYDQLLPPDQEGIIGYFLGTKNYVISKQYLYDRDTNTQEFQGMNFSPPNGDFSGGRYIPIQKWEFDVPPGKYVFRVASHKATPSDAYEKTSTRLIGTTAMSNVGPVTRETKELIIDACTGDVDLLQTPLLIYDLSRIGKGCTLVDRTSVCEGYIYEDMVNKIPIEMAAIRNTVGNAVKPQFTDHNGYYFCATRKYGLEVELYGYKNGIAGQFLGRSAKTFDSAGALHRDDVLYVYRDLTEYLDKDRYYIRGRVVLCSDNNVGISGALVVHTRGSYGYTDNNGYFNIIAHNIGDTINARSEKLIISQRGTCVLLSCGTSDCSYCIEDIAVLSPDFTPVPRVITVSNITLRIKGLNQKGPQMGGRYQAGIVLRDWLGRETFVQTDDNKFFDIPSIHETLSYNYSTVNFNLTGVVLPAWCTSLYFAVTDNLAWDDMLEWTIDRLQFIDNSGYVNNVAPTAIRLYYEGLGEYNKQKNFSTNTAWQFILNDTTIINDEVEFMVNGDGTIFPKLIRVPVQYDKNGKYIQIDYIDDLKNLKENAKVKLIRPKTSSNYNFFYGKCPIIKVSNGTAQTLTGTLNIVDSYLITRQVPVPIVVTKKSTDDQGKEITTSSTITQLRSYPFPFEHHSPSDTWGNHCWNKGKVNFKNPEEKQSLILTQVDVSDALSDTGSFNGLHSFDAARNEIFDRQEWGAITVGITDVNTVLLICEHDNFTCAFDDNRIIIDANNNVRGTSPDQLFSKPRRKVGSNYGCQEKDINTITRLNGQIWYMDSSRGALVEHDFDAARDIAMANGFSSWLVSKIKYVQQHPGHYFHACVDPKQKRLLLTNTKLNLADIDYVNLALSANISSFETVAIQTAGDERALLRYYSFTPEYMGTFEGDNNDIQLLSFRRGAAWSHYHVNSTPNRFLNYYGIDVEPVLELIINGSSLTKEKFFKYLEVYCKEVQWYSDRVETEHGQVSRIMPKWWRKQENFWSVYFMCAINTIQDSNIPIDTGINALLDGDTLRGRWAKVRLRIKSEDVGKYFELSAVEGYFTPIEKSAD